VAARSRVTYLPVYRPDLDVICLHVHTRAGPRGVGVARRGVATGGGVCIAYPPPPPKKKSVQVNFLWGKNNVRTAIEHEYWSFIPPQNIYSLPKKKILATPLVARHAVRASIRLFGRLLQHCEMASYSWWSTLYFWSVDFRENHYNCCHQRSNCKA